MKITVTSDSKKTKKIFCPERLKDLHPLHLFVDDGSGQVPDKPSVVDDGSFSDILNLADPAFYPGGRKLKDNTYECSIKLFNGTIGAGSTAQGKCQRVKQKLFPSLPFLWNTEREFQAFQEGARALDPDSVVALPDRISNFAMDVKAKITLTNGQSLRLVSEKTKADLFEPLSFGFDHVVRIDYADVDLPASLSDCHGFAHHCEALELNPDKDPILGIFKPIFREELVAHAENLKRIESFDGIGTLTRPGCCECARMDP